jgi:uncharacterized protein YjgD (DUF1641 family)
MAQPIPLELPVRDPRELLRARLQNAPVEHAEAVLAAYELLQGLHDRGVFDVLRGVLGAGDRILETAVEAAKKPESIRAIRNVLILGKSLASVEPELVKGFVRSLPEAIARTKAFELEAPGFWEILMSFRSKNLRRGLVLINSLLEAFGRNLPRGVHS